MINDTSIGAMRRGHMLSRSPIGQLFLYFRSFLYGSQDYETLAKRYEAQRLLLQAMSWQAAEIERLRRALTLCRVVAYGEDPHLPESLCDRADIIAELVQDTLEFTGDPYDQLDATSALAGNGLRQPVRGSGALRAGEVLPAPG